MSFCGYNTRFSNKNNGGGDSSKACNYRCTGTDIRHLSRPNRFVDTQQWPLCNTKLLSCNVPLPSSPKCREKHYLLVNPRLSFLFSKTVGGEDTRGKGRGGEKTNLDCLQQYHRKRSSSLLLFSKHSTQRKEKKIRKSLFPKKEARSGPQMPQHTELETPARFRDILERRKTLAHQEGALQNRINIVARSCKPIVSRFAS